MLRIAGERTVRRRRFGVEYRVGLFVTGVRITAGQALKPRDIAASVGHEVERLGRLPDANPCKILPTPLALARNNRGGYGIGSDHCSPSQSELEISVEGANPGGIAGESGSD